MAIAIKKDQSVYSGKGPLDSKSLVKTYTELVSTATWTQKVDGEDVFVAYNGMVVAV